MNYFSIFLISSRAPNTMRCDYSMNVKLKSHLLSMWTYIISFAIFLKTKQQTEHSLYSPRKKTIAKFLLLLSCQHLFQVSSGRLTTSAGNKVISELLGMVESCNFTRKEEQSGTSNIDHKEALYNGKVIFNLACQGSLWVNGDCHGYNCTQFTDTNWTNILFLS